MKTFLDSDGLRHEVREREFLPVGGGRSRRVFQKHCSERRDLHVSLIQDSEEPISCLKCLAGDVERLPWGG